MAQLNFTKQGNEYIAEVTGATSTFNVDIERDEPSRITVYQKASGATRYKVGQTVLHSDAISDLNFNVLLESKASMDYKFVSKTPVTKAIVG